MDIIHSKVLKKWGYSQTNLIEVSNGNKYIEKIEFYDQTVNRFNSFPYCSDECEIYRSILSPLEIPHVRIIENTKNSNANIFIMDYIEGITCEEAPEAIHLYKAAEKIGEVYHKSKINLSRAEKNIVSKYTLNKEKIYRHIKAADGVFDMQKIYPAVDYVFEKYEANPLFVNHFDIHMKNFIYNGYSDDLYLIDWAAMQISPFYTDLYVLLTQAKDVSADADKIIGIYKEYAHIENLSEEDIFAGGIIWNAVNIHWLLNFIGSDYVPFQEWAEELYNDLQNLIRI